ncbi:MFS transporter [Winogradskya consettensis]|uniref:MFS transporter n=1 Tax=Winogradskya consettensis TaxID=113560 RepID=A0A919VVD9_9ACTN|nr:MFS transporter [Actinoplanes consettensis]GIM70798.1 MFS transporter [Actinoplanes consettensis]
MTHVLEERKTAKGLILATIAIAQLLLVLDATIVSIALPTAQVDLGISDSGRQWVVTAYTLAFGGLLLLGGRISDYAGRKRSFLIGLIGFALASALGGFAVNQGMLFAARGLQGAFAALMAPAALSLLAVTFTGERERARAFAIFGGIAAGGGALGLLLGGLLTEYVSWRWCLGVGTPIALVTAIVAAVVLTESKAAGRTRYDVTGAVTVTAALVALVYGLSNASSQGWSAGLTIGLIAAGVVLLVAFWIVEHRSANPLLPLRVVQERNRGGSYLVGLMLGTALLAFFLFLTFYLQLILGYSALRSGLAFLPFTLGIGAGVGVGAKLATLVRPGVLIASGLLVAAAGLALLTRIGVDTSYWTHVLPPVVLISLGLGLTFGPVQSTALVGIGAADAGVASAMVNTTQQIGGSIGTALLNTIFANAVTGYVADHGAGAVQLATIHGYAVTFWVGAGILVASAVVAIVFITATRAEAAEAAGRAGPA